MKTSLLASFLFLLANTGFASTHWGPVRALGHGTVRTFVEMGDKGEPAQVGVFLSEGALDKLPDTDREIVLPLPQGTGFSLFENVVINWNAHGHDPKEIYGVPHFDFHFYLIPESVRMSIKCDAGDKACKAQPAPQYLPPQYGPTPDGVPMMGWHWVDLTSPEFHGKPFTSTFIYGYYDAKLAFLEPMITREFLAQKTRFSAPIRQPQAFQREGSYPRSYATDYDDQLHGTRVALYWH